MVTVLLEYIIGVFVYLQENVTCILTSYCLLICIATCLFLSICLSVQLDVI